MSNLPDSAGAGEKLVRAFCSAWQDMDIEAIMDGFAEDAVYHNVPVDPIQGHAGIRQIFQSFTELFSDARLDILNLAAAPGVVLAERVDYFTKKADGGKIVIPVTGVFQIREGKIKHFSDYFDLASFERQAGFKL